MCLRLQNSNNTSHIAQEDITVYKLYRKKENHLISFYRLAKTDLGEQPRVEMRKKVDYVGLDEIVEQGYHSFTTLEDVSAFAKDHNYKASKQKLTDSQEELVIHECTIPKGTEYYLGTFRWYFGLTQAPSIASEQLTVGKEIII